MENLKVFLNEALMKQNKYLNENDNINVEY